MVTSRAAVARHFGRAERTIGEWIARGMPGKRGRYDLTRISAWLEAEGLNRSREPEVSTDRRRLDRIRADREELRLRVASGESIDAVEARRLITRRIGEAKAVLGSLPDRILSICGDLGPSSTAVRAAIDQAIKQTYRILADLTNEEPLAAAKEI